MQSVKQKLFRFRQSFWQVPLDEESKEKCSFITYDGIFTPQNMSYGLSGAPAPFQNLIMKVLRGCSWKYVLCYVDDCIIFSTNFQQHLGHFNEEFNRFRQAGLKLSPKKCVFAQKKTIKAMLSVNRREES